MFTKNFWTLFVFNKFINVTENPKKFMRGSCDVFDRCCPCLSFGVCFSFGSVSGVSRSKIDKVTLNALRTRQSLVKGERLVRHEMRAVLHNSWSYSFFLLNCPFRIVSLQMLVGTNINS